jgi:lipoprotein-anchoring transpeptidase ErfK/SrfK
MRIAPRWYASRGVAVLRQPVCDGTMRLGPVKFARRRAAAVCGAMLLRSALLLLVACLFSACSAINSHIPTTADFVPRKGRAYVKIDLSEQRATLFRSGVPIAGSRVSTGRDGFKTPAGSFRVTQKNKNHRSSIYGDYVRDGRIVKTNVDARKDRRPAGAKFVGAPMPYFMRFNGSIGMHAGNVPYHPASHGCVRLPPHLARAFFRHVSVGTPVRVEY